MKASVRAVGFALWDPEAVILLCTSSRDHVQLYPDPLVASEGGQKLSFSDNRRNIILLTNSDRRFDLTPHVEDIYRLVIFAPPKELSRLGLPVMDVILGEGPPQIPRQRSDELRGRIDAEAVSFDLTLPSEFTVSDSEKKEEKKAPKKSKTLKSCMEDLAAELNDFPEVSIKQTILRPTLNRIIGRITKKQYQAALRDITEYKTVKERTAKCLFRWVEGSDGLGPELADAVKAFGKKEMTKNNLLKTAAEFGVTPNDLFLILSNERDDHS